MNKKLFTFLYIMLSSLANVAFTILVIAFIFAILFCVLRLCFRLPAGHGAYGQALIISFLVGLAASFFLFTKISTKIINKYGFARKFEEKWLDKDNKERRPKERKTKLPSSVLPTEQEREEQKRWGDN